MGQRRGELYTGYTMRLSYYFKILVILKITITWQDFCISEKMTFASLKRWHLHLWKDDILRRRHTTTVIIPSRCNRLKMCWFVSSLDHWRKEKIWCVTITFHESVRAAFVFSVMQSHLFLNPPCNDSCSDFKTHFISQDRLLVLLSEDELDILAIPALDVHHNHEFMHRPWNHGCLQGPAG